MKKFARYKQMWVKKSETANFTKVDDDLSQFKLRWRFVKIWLKLSSGIFVENGNKQLL